MWQCFSCNTRFIPEAYRPTISCPACGSHATGEILACQGETYGSSPVPSDAMVIDSLLRCAVDWPNIFNLVWGVDPGALNCLPAKHRKIVSDILQEKVKEEESDDYIDKKLHHIIVELLYVAYEKQVYDYVDSEIEKMNAENNRRY